MLIFSLFFANTMKDDAGADEDLCKICYDKKIDALILPCAHFAVCLDCSRSLTGHTNQCPICRGNIEKVQPVFRA